MTAPISNVEAYKNYEREVASNLEAQYTYLIFNERIEEACTVLGRLMDFKLISRWDERLSKKYKPFKKAGISTENRFKNDLRTDSNYMPEWLFHDIPYRFGTKLISLEHMGKRVEGEYSCDTTFQAKELDVEFRVLTTPKSSKDAIENIGKMYSEEKGKQLNTKTLAEEAEVGFARVYEINILNNVVNGYKVLGYMIITKSLNDGNFHVKLVLKYKVFKYLFINIVAAQRLFANTIREAMNMGDTLKMASLLDTRKAVEEQAKILKEEKDKLHKYKQSKKASEA